MVYKDDENTSQSQQTQPTRTFDAPLFYTNGVMVGFSNADFQLTATINGRPNVFLALPPSVAKALAKALNKAISDYERRTEMAILDTSELTGLLRKNKQ